VIDKFTGKEHLKILLIERTRQIVAKTKMPLGILIDKISGYRSSIYTNFQIG
jgi:hypothetical protein